MDGSVRRPRLDVPDTLGLLMRTVGQADAGECARIRLLLRAAHLLAYSGRPSYEERNNHGTSPFNISTAQRVLRT